MPATETPNLSNLALCLTISLSTSLVLACLLAKKGNKARQSTAETTMGRRLFIAFFFAVVAVCQLWLVDGGQLRGGAEIDQVEQLEQLLMSELSEEHRRELTDSQIEQMIGMNTDDERKLFLLDCFGDQPSKGPSAAPSASPTTSAAPSVSFAPTESPSRSPSAIPSVSLEPSSIPSVTMVPSSVPSSGPPSSSPTANCLFTNFKNNQYVGRVRNFFGGPDLP